MEYSHLAYEYIVSDCIPCHIIVYGKCSTVGSAEPEKNEMEERIGTCTTFQNWILIDCKLN